MPASWLKQEMKRGMGGRKVMELKVSKLSVRGKQKWLPRLAVLTNKRLELIHVENDDESGCSATSTFANSPAQGPLSPPGRRLSDPASLNSWVSRNGGFNDSPPELSTENQRSAAEKMHELFKEIDHDIIPLVDVRAVSHVTSFGYAGLAVSTKAPLVTGFNGSYGVNSEGDNSKSAKTNSDQRWSNGVSSGAQYTHIQISTDSDGENNGKVFDLRIENEEAGLQLVEEIQRFRLTAQEAERKLQVLRGRQAYVNSFLDSFPYRLFVTVFSHVYLACIIAETFIEKDIEEGAKAGMEAYTFRIIEPLYILSMLIDCSMSVFANGFRTCLHTDKWMKFEIMTAIFSLVDFVVMKRGGFSIMPLVIVVRVCRRWPTIRSIVETILHALSQVFIMFDIMFAFAVVFALFGMQKYREIDPESFGDFWSALQTVLKAVGDNPWMEDFNVPDEAKEDTHVFFRVAFTVVMQWVLLQVSVAIIINSFITKTQNNLAEEARQQDLIRMKREKVNPLNPLLKQLIQLYDSDHDLSMRTTELFDALDVDENNNLSIEELITGFKRMDFVPRIHLSTQDLRDMCTEAMLSPETQVAGLSVEDFEALTRSQIRSYCERQMTDVLKKHQGNSEEVSAYITFQKLTMSENAKLRAQLAKLERAIDSKGVTPSSSMAPLSRSGKEQVGNVEVKVGDRWCKLSEFQTLPYHQPPDGEVQNLKASISEVQRSVIRLEDSVNHRNGALEEKFNEMASWIKWHMLQQNQLLNHHNSSHAALV